MSPPKEVGPGNAEATPETTGRETDTSKPTERRSARADYDAVIEQLTAIEEIIAGGDKSAAARARIESGRILAQQKGARKAIPAVLQQRLSRDLMITADIVETRIAAAAEVDDVEPAAAPVITDADVPAELVEPAAAGADELEDTAAGELEDVVDELEDSELEDTAAPVDELEDTAAEPLEEELGAGHGDTGTAAIAAQEGTGGVAPEAPVQPVQGGTDETEIEPSAADLPFQVMPPLSDDDAEQLRSSIHDHGVMMPVLIDEDGVIIDGHHRAAFATALGIDYPTEVRAGLTDTQKRSMAYTLNLARRQLTRAQVRNLIAASLKADPQLSDREHGRRAGADHKTAGKVRTELEGRGEIPHTDTRTDTTGREQPVPPTKPAAKKPTTTPTTDRGKTRTEPAPAPIDAAAAEPLMKDFVIAIASDGTAGVAVTFMGDEECVIPLGGARLDKRITAAVAADLAYHLKLVAPKLGNLIGQLDRKSELS